MIYIKINHITANIPYTQCKLRFMLKGYNDKHQQDQISQVKLLPKVVSVDVQESLRVTSSILNKGQAIMLCVLVTSDQRNAVVHIGYILIDPLKPIQLRRAPLIGLADQTGYIVYSVIHTNSRLSEMQSQKQKQRELEKIQTRAERNRKGDQEISNLPFKQPSANTHYNNSRQNIPKKANQVIQKAVKIQNYQVTPQVQIKNYNASTKTQINTRNKLHNMVNVTIVPEKQRQREQSEDHRQNQGESENQIERQREKQETIRDLRCQINRLKYESEKYKTQIDQRVQKYELTIEMLRQELLNQSYISVLRDNQLFQLKNKGRIERLVRLKMRNDL